MNPYYHMTLEQIEEAHELIKLYRILVEKWKTYARRNAYSSALQDARRYLKNPSASEQKQILIGLRHMSAWIESVEKFEWKGDSGYERFKR